jgi:hypothetical protein
MGRGDIWTQGLPGVPSQVHRPPSEIKICSYGLMVSRGHFLRCPLSSLDNPMVGRLNPRVFRHLHRLFKNRRLQFEFYDSARDEQIGRTIPIPRPLSSTLTRYNTL